MTWTLDEVSENITILKAAYKRVAASGGVTQYSLNSGQGSTTVKQASLSEIRAELAEMESLYNELSGIENGDNFTIIRGGGY